jgi:uncharacterized membrane protein YfcA
LRAVAAVFAGTIVGSVSSMLGVAGGELIIPILIFAFGADIRTAGTASVLISLCCKGGPPIRLEDVCAIRARALYGRR